METLISQKNSSKLPTKLITEPWKTVRLDGLNGIIIKIGASQLFAAEL